MSGPLVIIGGGAIGGTLGAHLVRAGHDVLLCDADAAHVAAIREHGLRIEGPVNEFTVEIPAVTPDELPDRIDRAIVAVKSLHTRAAADLLRDRLAPDGYVLDGAERADRRHPGRGRRPGAGDLQLRQLRCRPDGARA